MKRSLLFSLALGITFLLSAQAYVPVLNENATWDVFKGSAFVPCGYESGGRSFIDGDTTIQGLDYKIIKEYYIYGSPPSFCPPFSTDHSQIYPTGMFIREDTLARKVYGIGFEGTSSEELLYDFSLNIGDTLQTDYFSFSQPGDNVIIDIDTITLLNNEQRRRFWLPNNLNYIEGIGGSTGIGNWLVIGLGVGWDLTCYRVFNVPLVDPMDLFNPMCVLSLGVNNVVLGGPVHLHPNPTNGPITITTEQAAGHTFNLLDLTGKHVFSSTLSSTAETLDLQNLEQGAYLYGLNGHVLGKLIVQH